MLFWTVGGVGAPGGGKTAGRGGCETLNAILPTGMVLVFYD